MLRETIFERPPQLTRRQAIAFFGRQPACPVGIEACQRRIVVAGVGRNGLGRLLTAIGVTIRPVKVAKPGDLERAFSVIQTEHIEALDVLGYSLSAKLRLNIAAFALKNRLPTIGTSVRNAEAGYLMSYGANLRNMYRRAAAYVDKILKGAKPAGLPVEQPTRFYLTVNLKTAEALGITIPRSTLLRADRLIE